MTNDVDDYLGMTPEQRQDWARKEKQDTQRLGEDITQFFRWLCEQNSQGPQFNYNGMWNCRQWLLPALDRNQIFYQHTEARAHLAEAVSFTINDATLTIAECDVSANTTHGNEDDEGDDDPHFLGTVLELNLIGSTASTNFRLGLRWFAFDSEAAGKSMTMDDFYQRRWAFPAPVWCHMLGNNDQAKKWLTLTKLSMSN
ncbi:hypothetical protein [Methylorubrum extorquens]|uniref:hypothetical protein n=1 Tax=Methylorubrum extorquens TaxID=408 RepID=UPI001EE5EE68|nr:hypothetical protein [Methylorubrum extorquens]MCG5249608.1 hypothetical protein [Methylorubrum extorquens]